MASFKIVILESAKAEFQKIPFPARRQVNQLLFRLRENPLPEGCFQFAENKFGLSIHGWKVYYLLERENDLVVVIAFVRVE